MSGAWLGSRRPGLGLVEGLCLFDARSADGWDGTRQGVCCVAFGPVQDSETQATPGFPKGPRAHPQGVFSHPIDGPVENGGAAPPCGQSVPCCLQAAQWGASATPPEGAGLSACSSSHCGSAQNVPCPQGTPSRPGLLTRPDGHTRDIGVGWGLLCFSPVSAVAPWAPPCLTPISVMNPEPKVTTELLPRSLRSPGRE